MTAITIAAANDNANMCTAYFPAEIVSSQTCKHENNNKKIKRKQNSNIVEPENNFVYTPRLKYSSNDI